MSPNLCRKRLALVLALALVPLVAACGHRQLTTAGAAPAPKAPVVPTAGGGTLTGLGCFDCHTVLSDNPGKIRFNHAAHAGYGAHCNFCHGAEDHVKAPTGAARHSHGVSKACAQCHDGQRAPNGCRSCHTDMAAVKPVSHQRADFGATHGKSGDRGSCTTCHASTWCAGCHGVSLPHSAQFRARHGREAKAKPTLCGKCHDPVKCTACHNGLPLPHPPTFVSSHGRLDAKLCAKCHQRSFCANCHAGRNPHQANWRAVHGRPEQRAGQQCAACHTSKFCQDCHGVTMPHPDGFRARHGADAKAKGEACRKCHEATTCDRCHGLAMPHPGGFGGKAHGTLAKADRLKCGRCHGNSFCRDCHGTEMPHPTGYVMGHNREATFDAKSRCMKCHQTKWCRKCHEEAGAEKPDKADKGENAGK